MDERGVFVQHYDTDALDASLLLVVLTRFLPPNDERVVATVLAIADELTEEGMVLRYRVDETDDGLAGEEGSFAICSFWLVSALVEIGEVRRARDLCDKLLSYASPLGLYAGDRPALGPPPRQLPSGVHPPGPDQRRHARDPGGPGPGARPPAAGPGADSRALCTRLNTSSPTSARDQHRDVAEPGELFEHHEAASERRNRHNVAQARARESREAEEQQLDPAAMAPGRRRR